MPDTPIFLVTGATGTVGSALTRLIAARVLVLGAGGLGAPLLQYLAAAGIGTLGVVDDDTVDLSNLQRQIIHRTGDVGVAKVASAQRALGEINPEVTVHAHKERLTAANAERLIAAYDIVADGTDKKIFVVQRNSLLVLNTFGQGGRLAGEFVGVGSLAVDSKGNLFTGETFEGKRVQRWVLK